MRGSSNASAKPPACRGRSGRRRCCAGCGKRSSNAKRGKRSETHEARWLNLLGFGLRPGFGMALDDWRVAQTWKLLQGRLLHPGPMCRAEWWILRRIAGGLPAGQQRALAEPLLGELRAAARSVAKGRGSELRLGCARRSRTVADARLAGVAGPSWKVELGQIARRSRGERKSPLRAAGVGPWADRPRGCRCTAR